MAELVGGSFGLVIAVMIVAGIAYAICLPFMAWSVVRNIKQVRMQFERLNESLDARASESRSGPFGH